MIRRCLPRHDDQIHRTNISGILIDLWICEIEIAIDALDLQSILRNHFEIASEQESDILTCGGKSSAVVKTDGS